MSHIIHMFRMLQDCNGGTSMNKAHMENVKRICAERMPYTFLQSNNQKYDRQSHLRSSAPYETFCDRLAAEAEPSLQQLTIVSVQLQGNSVIITG
jgi:hypothetical protein